MCVDISGISDNFECFEREEDPDYSIWNGRKVSSFEVIANQVLTFTQNSAIKLAGKIDLYVNTNHDTCPRGHEAHYIYTQWPARPIYLCDEQYDSLLGVPCPFEYYSFLRHLNQGK